MIEFDIEYTDFYNFGINEILIKEWSYKNKFNKKIVIPNYFYPFKNKNIKIRSVYKNTSQDIFL